MVWDGEDSVPCRRFFAAARELGMQGMLHAVGGNTGVAIATAIESQIRCISHLEQLGTAEITMLADSNLLATLLPAAAFRKGGPFPPARLLIDAGAALALATDFSPHHASTLNMQAVVSLACTHLAMTPAEALTAATFNAAHTLGRADVTGSLEPGKRADVVLLNTADYRDLAYHLGTNLVHMTLRCGNIIYREGKVAQTPAEDAA